MPGLVVTRHWGNASHSLSPARLRSRPRRRFACLAGGPAGEHAQPRPRPGLHGPQLPDPRTDRRHPLPQGRVRRRGHCHFRAARADRLPASSWWRPSRNRAGHNGYRRLLAAGSRPLGALQLLAACRGFGQRRAVGSTRKPDQAQCRAAPLGGHRHQRLRPHRDESTRRAGRLPSTSRRGPSTAARSAASAPCRPTMAAPPTATACAPSGRGRMPMAPAGPAT